MVRRVVTEFHDYSFNNAYIDTALSDANGTVDMEGHTKILRKDRPYAPNHQIIISKPGYKTYVFSQYSASFQKISQETDNIFVKSIFSSITAEKSTDGSDEANEKLYGGYLKLEPLKEKIGRKR